MPRIPWPYSSPHLQALSLCVPISHPMLWPHSLTHMCTLTHAHSHTLTRVHTPPHTLPHTPSLGCTDPTLLLGPVSRALRTPRAPSTALEEADAWCTCLSISVSITCRPRVRSDVLLGSWAPARAYHSFSSLTFQINLCLVATLCYS